LEKVLVSKLWPSTIIIHSFYKSISAKIIVNEKIYYVDQNGFNLTEIDNIPVDLPNIYPTELVFNSQGQADWMIRKVIELINEQNKLSLMVLNAYLESDEQRVRLETYDDIEIILPLSKNSKDIAASLQIIISRFRIEGKNIDSIDFQFDKPLLRFKDE
jgi:cell division septal protein FtsQ